MFSGVHLRTDMTFDHRADGYSGAKAHTPMNPPFQFQILIFIPVKKINHLSNMLDTPTSLKCDRIMTLSAREFASRGRKYQ